MGGADRSGPRVVARLHGYLPALNAGAERMVHALLRHLDTAGYQVEVQVDSHTAAAEYAVDGVLVRYGPTHPPGADLIVSHLGTAPAAARLARRLGVPWVHVVHNDYPATRRTLRRHPADLTVFNSRWLADALGGDGIIIPPPVAVDDYRVTPGQRVTLINLSADKGATTFWALADRMPDVDFLGVVGGYGDQIVHRRPNVDVQAHTFAMRPVYRATRLLLMPSIRESWGRVGIEAMCSGIPVIAHPTPGLREALGDAGIFIDRDDLDSWQAAIRRLADPTEYAAAAARARARAAELDPTADLERWRTAIDHLVGDTTMPDNHGVFTKNGDTRTAATAAEAVDLRFAGWAEQPTDDNDEILRGAALDDALETAGLSKTGTADDKRARLAAYLEQQHDGSDGDAGADD